MTKTGGKIKMFKKVIPKIEHSSILRVTIPAGMASPKPPLGSQLGQRNINVQNFCKEFNSRTEIFKLGVPLPCRVKVRGPGAYELIIHHPPATYFLKHAAGIEKGQMFKEDVAGKITLKHLYEIASLKAEDPSLALMDLRQICIMLVGVARSCGIKVVSTLDPDEHAEFMKKREENVQNILKEREISKQAKLSRTA